MFTDWQQYMAIMGWVCTEWESFLLSTTLPVLICFPELFQPAPNLIKEGALPKSGC